MKLIWFRAQRSALCASQHSGPSTQHFSIGTYFLCLKSRVLRDVPQAQRSFRAFALGSFLLFRIPNSAIRISRMALLKGGACSLNEAISSLRSSALRTQHSALFFRRSVPYVHSETTSPKSRRFSAGKPSKIYLAYCGRSNLIAIPSTVVQV